MAFGARRLSGFLRVVVVATVTWGELVPGVGVEVEGDAVVVVVVLVVVDVVDFLSDDDAASVAGAAPAAAAAAASCFLVFMR